MEFLIHYFCLKLELTKQLNRLHLFAYGTLMDEEIFSGVSRAASSYCKATLSHYFRTELLHRSYPGIHHLDGAEVDGIIYLNLTETQWLHLDLFEGNEYERKKVEVISNGVETPAWTYILRNEYFGLITGKEWSFERFLQMDKDLFINSYPGWDSLKRGVYN